MIGIFLTPVLDYRGEQTGLWHAEPCIEAACAWCERTRGTMVVDLTADAVLEDNIAADENLPTLRAMCSRCVGERVGKSGHD